MAYLNGRELHCHALRSIDHRYRYRCLALTRTLRIAVSLVLLRVLNYCNVVCQSSAEKFQVYSLGIRVHFGLMFFKRNGIVTAL